MTRVEQIIEAGRRVDTALDLLTHLDAADERFNGALADYEHALQARQIAESVT